MFKANALIIDSDGFEVMVAINPADPRLVAIAVFAKGNEEPLVAVMLPVVTLRLFLGGL